MLLQKHVWKYQACSRPSINIIFLLYFISVCSKVANDPDSIDSLEILFFSSKKGNYNFTQRNTGYIYDFSVLSYTPEQDDSKFYV